MPVMSMTSRTALLTGAGWVGFALMLAACGKSASSAASAPSSAAECPPGQTFDGQFCRVTGEPPAEAAATPAAADTSGSASAAVGSGGTAGSSAAAPGSTAPSSTAAASPESPGTAAEPAVTIAPAATPQVATPVDVSMAAQAGPLITYLASSHLPSGARPLGAPFAAQFAEGQVFEQQVQLTPGKCYTVVAAGLPPVSEVNIVLSSQSLLLSPAQTVPPLAEDGGSGPQAVLGSRNGCYRAVGSEAWLLVTVPKGRGVVAGQVFEK